MNKEEKKILIVGSSAKEYALAKYFVENSKADKVYVAPGNVAVEEYAERVDIRETAVSELLEFAIKNEITLTVVTSDDAIRADIVGDFKENSQPVFAPSAGASNFITSRAAAKKFLYRMHIPTAKFGIFEKQQLAIDYVKNENFPLLITTDKNSETDVRAVCSTIPLAVTCINDIFLRNENKVVIEEFLYGHQFTLYVITDGYLAIPIAAVGDYKFQEDGDGGLFTLGSGAYLPDYKVSLDVIDNMMEYVVNPIMLNLQKKQKPYCGVMGIECVLNKDSKPSVIGFTPFFKDHDTQAVLNSLNIDLYDVMIACINGSFADDYSEIPLNEKSILSCVLSARNGGSVITGLELVDDTTDISYFNTGKNNYFETLTNKGRTLVVTQSAATFSRARELLYDNIADIYFDGKKYRRDICIDVSD